MQPKFLTIDQLIERWSGIVKRTTLANWRVTHKRKNEASKRGPSFMRLEGRILYPIAEVEKYEAANDNSPRVAARA